MPRVAMVTRRLVSTEVEALAVDTSQEKTFRQYYVVPRSFRAAEDLLKALKNAYDTPEFKVVSIVSSKTQEVRYGMTEQEFIKYAKVLEPNQKGE